MNTLIKYPQRQDCHFKLSKGNSGETSINLSTEIALFLNDGKTLSQGDEIPVSFILYKEDFIKAICHIVDKLPLFKTSSTSSTQIEYNNNLFVDYMESINSFFKDNDSEIYNATLSAVSAPRYYLKNLNDRGLNVRKFLMENNSTLYFSKDGENFILRLLSEEVKPQDQQIEFKTLPPLDQPLQQIFYGAPGTGKSHTIKKTTDKVDSKFVVRTTFHPDSDYSTFVGAYKPQMRRPERIYGKGVLTTKLKEMKDAGVAYPCHKFAAKYWESVKKLSVVEIKEILKECDIAESMEKEIVKGMAVGESLCNQSGESKIVYAYTPQAFLKAYITAWQNPEQPVYLIIEEINRGNCAQIFGDLFQLLDRGDDGQSCYPIKADQDMQMHLMEEFAGYDALPENIRSGEELVLPSNLYIWATMNTSDQSLFPIDSAFKRRWEWKYVPITQGRDKGQLLQWCIEAEGVKYDWWSFLEVMNKRVGEITSSEDKKLGFFFCKDKNGVISADKFVSKVMFYLWNDVFKDYPNNPIATYLKEEGGEFTYGDFYTTNDQGEAVVREELVKRLLDELGVKKAGKADNGQQTKDNEEVYDESADVASPGKERKETLSSVSINGKLFTEQEYTQFDLYMNVLREIGIVKAGAAIESMKFTRKGSKMATRNPLPQLAEGYTYVKEGEYYYIKGANPYTLIRILEELKTVLNLDMVIAYR